MSENGRISSCDLPGLYQAADSESNRSQRLYLWILRSYLILLVVGTAVAFFTGTSRALAIVSAVCLFAGLFVSFLLALKRYDRTWYSARAVAESVKTRAWRYMMRSEPYHTSMAQRDTRRMFLSDLQQILDQNRDATRELSGESAANGAITKKMDQIRGLDLRSRISLYQSERIEDQLDWYARKAKTNRRLAGDWFVAMLILQTSAVLCTLLRIAHPGWKYLPTEIFGVAAASVLSWLQAKRFNDLSTSYSLAAHEIAIIRDQIGGLSSEEQLSAFVNDAENAFSREHTQWAARRGS